MAKSKYDTYVKPRFKEIERWLNLGATDKEIFEQLGISKNCFYKYLKEYADFNDLIKKSRRNPVEEIKAAMFKAACGYHYTETEVTENSLGQVTTRTTTRYAKPSETAQLILLKHWDKEHGWTSDPQQLELKKQELKLKEKEIERKDW